MLTYTLFGAVAALGLFQLAKDWRSHEATWRRLSVLVLILLIAIGGMVNGYYTQREVEEGRRADEARSAALEKGQETAQASLETSTRLFLADLARLSEKLTSLEVQVKTADLRKEAAQLRVDLAATRKALNPPRAILDFSFGRAPDDGAAVRKTTLPVKDHVVGVIYSIANRTDAVASEGMLIVRICNACEFVSEPAGCKHMAGQPKTERNCPFGQILPRSWIGPQNVEVKVPPNVADVKFQVDYRCRTCIVPDVGANTGTIVLSR